VSRILGHKAVAGTTAVSGIYDRFDRLPEIRSALATWAAYVEGLVSGERKHGEVVNFETASIDTRRAISTRGPMTRPVA
jgi:hypothetical protein